MTGGGVGAAARMIREFPSPPGKLICCRITAAGMSASLGSARAAPRSE